jgi:hypothetical protein
MALTTHRSRGRATAALLAALAALYPLARRPILTWGATTEEAGSDLPGDELLEEADGVSTRAITIGAPATAVWPWLAQMGPSPRGGAYTDVEPFAEALEAADGVLELGAPFHIHFSDIAYANRNETKHLPYGEGTLRAEPLAEAFRRFDRPATVISESPDEGSHQAIRAILTKRRRGSY